MPTIETQITIPTTRSELLGGFRPVPAGARDIETLTDGPRPEALLAYWRRLRLHQVEHRLDDLVIGLELAERDRTDDGVRIDLDDFIREQGFDPDAL